MGPSLCENCHKRPKCGTHRFCGRTCAAQAAPKPVRSKQPQLGPRNTGRQKGPPPVQLCIYCGQKPKFNNFDYCGKSCAALANAAQTKPVTTQGVPKTKQKATHIANAPQNNVGQGQAPTRAPKAPGTKKVAVPQDDSTEESEEKEDGAVSTDLDAYPSDSGSESEEEQSVPAVAVPQPDAKGVSKRTGSGAPSTAPGVCAIPGCGQPSHVDRNGVKTGYCSKKHREESVKLGLETACIMCHRYPQGSSDYFCSSACRNQSMTKT